MLPFTQKAAASALETTADLLEVLGAEAFRAQAYRSAARSIEALTNWDEAAQKNFQGVPKVGSALAGALSEALQIGSFGPLTEALAQLPPGVVELLGVRGLGPKKVRALWQGGFDSLEALREGLDDGSVTALKGFGAKTAATLLEAVEFVLAAQGRQRMNTAHQIAEQLAAKLAHFDARVSGDVRRNLETTRSVRVTVSATPQEIRAALPELALEQVDKRPVLSGTWEGVPIELPYAAADVRGALDLMMGGGAAYRENLRSEAARQGFDLNGRGLHRGKQGSGETLQTPAEQDVLAALGLPYRPAEYRDPEHDAVWQSLPQPTDLIQPQDIKGYIHTHSTWSDGAASLREMVDAAQQLGGYLGTADHSRSAFYANGLTPERLRAQIKEVRELQRAGLPVIAGSEVDILEDGSLDFDDELLSELDYVVASVHSHFTLSGAAQTERLIKAVSHPLITVLGHATGRLLLRRPSYALDLDAVLDACEIHQTVVEINASPYRLDIDWRFALRYRARLKFALNTDAHAVHGLSDIHYGALVARKAGLTAAEVVNTLPQADFLAFVAAQRRSRSSAS
ncbi:DNA polymerase/3'-5' exonuclease PolX [Deinococcus psychrotolerans]|uniref:DNA polymerase/3'-5' exonuclease PolX n=1 Tax=Deinococcus psychrotolerans TaxID=2489213 RepID=A0A3G8YBB4_9DEIO|nr:DNA polymerase/3'-5' exonuclease PolX [Deinococcus psychrotolerans]AZI42662.1 DNA polymerase/3'-5' exonuclease PolX [Deinococcus psychrotolerans]